MKPICPHLRETRRLARVPGTMRLRYSATCLDCGASVSTLWPPKFVRPKKRTPGDASAGRREGHEKTTAKVDSLSPDARRKLFCAIRGGRS